MSANLVNLRTSELVFTTLLLMMGMSVVPAGSTESNKSTQINSGNPARINSDNSMRLQSKSASEAHARLNSKNAASSSLSVTLNSIAPREVKRRGIEVKYRFSKIAEYCGIALDSSSDTFDRRSVHRALRLIQSLFTNQIDWNDKLDIPWRPELKQKVPVHLYPDLKDIPTDKLVYELELESPNQEACAKLEDNFRALEASTREALSKFRTTKQSAKAEVSSLDLESIICIERLKLAAKQADEATRLPGDETLLSSLKTKAEIVKFRLAEARDEKELQEFEKSNVDLSSVAVTALAKETEPSFENVDEETVFNFFDVAYKKGAPWFIEFMQRVSERSGGAVAMTEVDPKDCPGEFRVEGVARYFSISKIGGHSRTYGSFSPAYPPFKLFEKTPDWMYHPKRRPNLID